jgi:hypothetical protein
MRDASGRSLPVIDAALEEGRVLLDGAPYTWEPDPMVCWLDERRPDPADVSRSKDQLRFEFLDEAPA